MKKQASKEQTKIITTLDTSLFVKAGAGAGKTSTLVSRLVYALLPQTEGEKPALQSIDEALVITYTKKAAEELQSRVSELLLKEGNDDLALSVSGAWICTIHKMCERILRSSALEVGIDPEFKMVEGQDEDYLRWEASSKVLQKMMATDSYKDLFEAYGTGLEGQDESGALGEAVAHGRGAGKYVRKDMSALMIASEIFRRAASSLHGFDSIVVVGDPVSTKVLAQSLKTTIQQFLDCFVPNPKNDNQMKLVEGLEQTVDALTAFEMAPAEGAAEGAAEDLAHIVAEAPVPEARIVRASKTNGPEVCEARDALKRALLDMQFNFKSDTMHALAEEALALAKEMDATYQNLKQEQGVLDTTDLLRLTLEALKSNEAVRKRYRGQFKLIMVDEFQDTDAQQLEIVRLLAGERDIFCYVGDEQQAIYRFRGADVEQYRQVLQAEKNVLTLKKNYRSHDDVLRFVNKALGESGILEHFMDLEHGRSEDEEDIQAFARALPHRIYIEHTHRPAKKKGFSFSENLVEENAGQIANRLFEMHKAGIPYAKMALLLRRMTSIDRYMKALSERGINAVVAKGSGFADAPEIRTVASVLTFLGSPYDTQLGLLPVLEGSLFQLDDQEIALIMKQAKDSPSQFFVETLSSASKKTEAFYRACQSAAPALAKGKASLAMRAFIQESGWLYRLEKKGPVAHAQAANILEALDIIERIVDKKGLGVSRAPRAFEDYLARAKQEPAALTGETQDALTIMTVHGAKGLEFDVVAVAECFGEPHKAETQRLILSKDTVAGEQITQVSLKFENKILDLPDSLKQPAPLEREDILTYGAGLSTAYDWRQILAARENEAECAEAIRLLYVALTRAKEAVVVGLTTYETKKSVKPELAVRFLEACTGRTYVPTTEEKPQEDSTVYFDYGGSLTGVLTTKVLSYSEHDKAEDASAESTQEIEEPEQTPFVVFEQEKRTAPPRPHYANEEVRSYSMDAHLVAQDDDDEEGRLQKETSWFERRARDKHDEVLAFGEAFHQLAQIAAEHRSFPSQARIKAIVSAQGLLETDAEKRLSQALKAWWESPLRKEMFEKKHLIAEAPFFKVLALEDASPSAEAYLTGFIDLVAWDEGDASASLRHAFIADYKTGEKELSSDEAYERHRMQATYYAWVMQQEGFEEVSVSFVLVENCDADGAPLYINFHFDDQHPAILPRS